MSRYTPDDVITDRASRGDSTTKSDVGEATGGKMSQKQKDALAGLHGKTLSLEEAFNEVKSYFTDKPKPKPVMPKPKKEQ